MFHNIYLVLHVRLCIFRDMDQELEAVMNSGPRLITPETWVFLIDFAHSSPTPVTTDFMEYMFDICMLFSLPPSIPYAAALLLHRLHGISPLEGWTGQQLFLVTIIVAVKFLCEYPSPPRNGWWSVGLFEVKELNCMEAEFCWHLDWHVVISGPELESFLAFCYTRFPWVWTRPIRASRHQVSY